MEGGRRAHIGLISWVGTTLCLASYTTAFSHGASLSACTDMMPNHLRVQLHSPSNNYITLHTNMSFYSPGDKVPVTVRSTRDFMGFLLQARTVSNDEIVGTFVFIPPGSKLLNCFEDGDTVTHSDKSLKRNLSFVWKAPDQPIGDIKFFISIVQSYFVYWAKIESAVVAQRGQTETLAGSSKKPDPVTPTASQGPSDPHHTGPISPVAATILLLHTPVPPASPTSVAARPALEPGLGVGSDAHPVADPKQLVWPSWAASSGSSRPSRQGLEPSLPTRDLGTTDALQSSPSQDDTPSYSTSDGAEGTASAATPRLCLMCKEEGQASPERGATLEASLAVTGSPSAPHVHTHLGDAAVTTAWFHEADAAGNLSSASRQMAERKPAPQPAAAGAKGEEEAVAGNTLPGVTRPAPESAVPGKGEDPGRGTRLLAAQLGILLVCTAALGLALAAARCLCAPRCQKRAEVAFSPPDPRLATLDSGEGMRFHRSRENSFVLVRAEYNWVSPSSRGKKTII
ncbi:reelin domain-containing protein 1 [Apus apus]|uniref:reelin domain-containing protein 1 n=1 Tax=Apus apus TaxID=8895 RepID=UPI0021F868AD|nr:reelin domain-containing protein 1 [Apus apus]